VIKRRYPNQRASWPPDGPIECGQMRESTTEKLRWIPSPLPSVRKSTVWNALLIVEGIPAHLPQVPSHIFDVGFASRHQATKATGPLDLAYVYKGAAARVMRLSVALMSYNTSSAGIAGSRLTISYDSAIEYSEKAIS
jgi:hypothetical protein